MNVERGQAIFPLVLVITVLLGLIGVTLAGASYTQSLLAGQRAFAEQARQAAQAGVDDALLRIVRDPTWFDDDGYTLTVQENPVQEATVEVKDTGAPVEVSQKTTVDDPAGNDTGYRTSLKISPAGQVWVSYLDYTNKALKAAQYTSGTPASSGCAADWTCTTVDDHTTNEYYATNPPNSIISSTSLDFDSSGNPWIAYLGYSASEYGQLKIAQKISSGSGGSCDDYDLITPGISQGSDAWDCTVVADHLSNGEGWYASMVFDPSGTAWISFREAENGSGRMRVATSRTGPGGSCNDAPFTANGSDLWDCSIIDDPGDSIGRTHGTQTIAIHPMTGRPWVFYGNFTAVSVKAAEYTPGTPESSGCAANWTCTVVDDRATEFYFPFSIAITPSGTVWVSFGAFDNISGYQDLMVARYVGGSSGTGCGTADPGAWTCAIVIDTPFAGSQGTGDGSLAIAPSGEPYLIYRSLDDRLTGANNGRLNLAQHVGSNGTGCASSEWSCSVVEDPAGENIGYYTSSDFDQYGTQWVSYRDYTNNALKVVACGNDACAPKTVTQRTIVSAATVRNVQRKIRVVVEVASSGNVQIISREELTI